MQYINPGSVAQGIRKYLFQCFNFAFPFLTDYMHEIYHKMSYVLIHGVLYPGEVIANFGVGPIVAGLSTTVTP